jgi:hypothetical protein
MTWEIFADLKMLLTYLRVFASDRATAWLHAHSDDLVCHKPSHIHSNRICTYAQFPRIFVEAACAVARRESERMNKPVAREDAVRKSASPRG